MAFSPVRSLVVVEHTQRLSSEYLLLEVVLDEANITIND